MLTVFLSASYSYGVGLSQDSLWDVIDRAEGSELAEAWLAMGLELKDSRFDSALASIDSAAAIYGELGMQEEWVYTLGHRIVLLEFQFYNRRADQTAQLIENQLYLIDSVQFRATVRNMIGNVKSSMGEPEKAIQFYLAALEEFNIVGDTAGQVTCLGDLARVYGNDGSHLKAFELQDSALNMANKFSGSSVDLLATLYNNAGTYLLEMGKIEEAKPYLEMGIEVASSGDEPTTLLFPYFTMGEIELAEENLKEARNYFRLSGDLLPILKLREERALAMEAKSIYHALNYDFDSSEYWLDQSLLVVDTTDDVLQKLEMFVLRSDVFSAIGEFERGLNIFREVDRLRGKWYSQEKSRQIEELRIEYETEKSEEENKVLRDLNQAIKDKNRRNTILFLAIFSLVLTIGLLMSYFVVRLRKLNKKVYNKHKTLVQQNHQLKELTAENELLVGIVAHDLKAPLSKIEGLMGLLSMEGGLSENQTAAIDMMSNVLSAGKDLVADILILSEAGQGRTPGLVEQELAPIFEGMKEQFKEATKRKDIDLVLVPPPGPIQTRIHSPYLIRVMDNLLSNAIKFSRTGTKVKLEWGKDADGPWCSVSDQGPGIQKSEIPKLFQRFAKLSNRPTAGESSNGLGLYIVKVLLDATKANIRVETEVGKGTRFFIRFPK